MAGKRRGRFTINTLLQQPHEPAQGVEWVWFAEPISASILAITGVLYQSGWRRAVATGREIPGWEPARFAIGWTTIGVALLSPVPSAAETMLSMHMLQHSLLASQDTCRAPNSR